MKKWAIYTKWHHHDGINDHQAMRDHMSTLKGRRQRWKFYGGKWTKTIINPCWFTRTRKRQRQSGRSWSPTVKKTLRP